MKIGFVGLACLILLTAPRPALAQAGSSCLDPENTVPEMADNPSHGWLTREGLDLVKARLVKAAGNHRNHWDGNTLVISCTVGGGPEYDMSAVAVQGDGAGAPLPRGGRDYYLALAKRTGHTPQQADVLYGKYSELAGCFYRYLRDASGTQVSEADSILKRHERILGISAPAAPMTGAGLEQRRADLKARIDAAKKRGDRNEMMKLAAEAQQLSAPLVAQAQQGSQRTDQQTWTLIESSYGELAEAAWRTRVTFLNCPCLGCTMKQ